MRRLTLLLFALLLVILVSQGEGCRKWMMRRRCRKAGLSWSNCKRMMGRSSGRQMPILEKVDFIKNSEMLDGMMHPGQMSALKAYDSDREGIFKAEGT